MELVYIATADRSEDKIFVSLGLHGLRIQTLQPIDRRYLLTQFDKIFKLAHWAP